MFPRDGDFYCKFEFRAKFFKKFLCLTYGGMFFLRLLNSVKIGDVRGEGCYPKDR